MKKLVAMVGRGRGLTELLQGVTVDFWCVALARAATSFTPTYGLRREAARHL